MPCAGHAAVLGVGGEWLLRERLRVRQHSRVDDELVHAATGSASVAAARASAAIAAATHATSAIAAAAVAAAP